MFAGIVERTGLVHRLERSAHADRAVRLWVDMGDLLDGLALGASVAVNGVCLTLCDNRAGHGAFDVIPETLRVSNLGRLEPGAAVNLERSLRLGDRVDGHFVQGHVDAMGTVERVERDAGEWKLWLRVPADTMRYVVRKGSIALDGVSLTVVDARDDSLSVCLIPTTLERTNLGARRAGEQINVETDVFARLIVDRCAAILREHVA